MAKTHRISFFAASVLGACLCALNWTIHANAADFPADDNIQVGQVSVSDYFPARGGMAESTVAAIAPGENKSNCPAGRLIFGSGTNIFSTALDGTSTPASTSLTPLGSLAPMGSGVTGLPFMVYDNQIVKMPDGSLVYSMEGATADPVVPQPNWWNETAQYPAKYDPPKYPGIAGPGVRARIFFMRSPDCGNTWTDMPSIDPATLTLPDATTGKMTLGLCGHPRLHAQTMTRPQYSELGGSDGHSLYADPYTGILYASSTCAYSTDTPDAGDSNTAMVLALLPAPLPNSQSWHVIGYYPGISMWRQAWTSLPSGATPLAIYSFNPGINTFLYYPLATAFIAAGGDASAYDLRKTEQLTPAGAAVNTEDAATVAALNVGVYVSTARSVGTFKNSSGTLENVLISNPVNVGASTASAYDPNNPAQDGSALVQHLGLDIIRASVDPSGVLSSPRLVAAITPPPSGNSYIGTFIEGPPAVNVQMYYWLEQLADDTAAMTDPRDADVFTVKYMLFVNGIPLGPPQVLSRSNGAQANWQYNTSSPFLGDYIHGSSYCDSSTNTVVFVPSWNDTSGLRYTFVNVPLLNRTCAGVAWNKNAIFRNPKFNPSGGEPNFSWSRNVITRQTQSTGFQIAHPDCARSECNSRLPRSTPLPNLQPACAPGWHRDGARCAPDSVRCPVGMTMDEGHCQQVPVLPPAASSTCRAGEQWNGRECISTQFARPPVTPPPVTPNVDIVRSPQDVRTICPQGTAMNAGRCAPVETMECPANTLWNGKVCMGARGMAFCPRGMQLRNGACVH